MNDERTTMKLFNHVGQPDLHPHNRRGGITILEKPLNEDMGTGTGMGKLQSLDRPERGRYMPTPITEKIKYDQTKYDQIKKVP